jgi:ABC-type uncharacterized transport system involved in gliding motility auxiliary subunit
VRRSNSLLGLVGIILLVFAGAAAVFTGAGRGVDIVYIAVHAGFGVLALIAYLSSGIDNLRDFVGQRSTKYGANALVYTVGFIAILGLLNYISVRRHQRWDLTEAGVYSLSPQSKSVVEALEKDLVLRAFVEGGESPELRDLFDSYRYASGKVAFHMIDPERDPVAAEQYKITQYNTVHVEYGDQSAVVTQPTEESITNTIIKVTRGVKKVICVIEGHGEPSLDDLQAPDGYAAAKRALENENYEVKPVLLATQEKVPDECSAVVAGGPKKPFLESEVRALETYLTGGGRLLALLAPRQGAEVKPVLANWGVKVGDDVIVDQVMRLFQGPAMGLAPLANTYGAHDITRDFTQRTIFPMTRSVSADAAGKTNLQVTELVKTSPSSWAETDLDGVFQRSEVSLDPGADKQGPVSIAAAVTTAPGGEDKRETRLVVFGSAEFADNRNIEGTFFNRDLFLNSVGWLVGESDLVSIRPRTMRASRAQFTPEEGTVIFYLSVLVLPEVLLLIGLAVWWRRANA